MRMLHCRILLCCICLLGGCSEITENAEILKATIDSETVRELIANYIETHPNAFTSSGRVESADEIRKAILPKKTSGKLFIGKFYVDLDKKTYALGHLYKQPGEKYFDSWEWKGSFQIGSEGQWMLGEPRQIQAWGP